MNSNNKISSGSNSSNITVSRRTGNNTTVDSDNATTHKNIPEEEPAIIGVRRHADPVPKKKDSKQSAANKKASSEKKPKVNYGTVLSRRPSSARSSADSSISKNPAKNIDLSGAINGAGSAMLAAPESLRSGIKPIINGTKDFIRKAPAAVSDFAKEIPSLLRDFFTQHNFVNWVKTRTPKQWVKIAAATLGFALVIVLGAVFLFMDSMLDKINYVAADHYGQISQSEADALYWASISESDVATPTDTSSSDMELEALTLTLDKFTEDMFDIPEEDVINILLLGTDTRSGKYVRDNSDTMMVMSLDTKRHTIKLTSFMRDSYVTIPGYRGKYRLNAAFAFGGADLLFKTLEHNFNIKVDKFVRVNFTAFTKVVNIIGGIEMEVTKAEAKYMSSHKTYGKFPRYKAGAGVYNMTGAEALNYARCRKVDSDFGRTDRQRKVLIAIADKLKGSKVSTLYDLMNEILPLVETNVSKDEIYSLIAPALASISKEIETLNVPVKGSWKDYNANGAWVLSLDFKINQKAIRAHIYSTTKLDISEKVWQSSYFESGSGNTTKATTTTTTTTTTEATESTESTEPTSSTTSTENTTPTSTSSTTSTTKSTTTSSESTSSTTKSTSESTTSSTEATTTTTKSTTEPTTTTTTTTTTKKTTTTTTTTKKSTTTSKSTTKATTIKTQPSQEEGAA